MKTFLVLKNWHIFVLLIPVPFILIIAGDILMKISGIEIFNKIFPILAGLIIISIYFLWLWSLGSILSKHVIKNKYLNIYAFRIYLIITVILFFIVTPYIKTHCSSGCDHIVTFLSFLSFFSLVYCIFFITKIITMIEKKLGKKTNTPIVDFIFIWIIPLGIWFIQPRINEIFKKTEN